MGSEPLATTSPQRYRRLWTTPLALRLNKCYAKTPEVAVATVSPPSNRRSLGWLGLALGASGTALGIYSYSQVVAAQEAYNTSPSEETQQTLIDTMSSANGLLVGGFGERWSLERVVVESMMRPMLTMVGSPPALVAKPDLGADGRLPACTDEVPAESQQWILSSRQYGKS